jgi:hypothetical protein
MKFDVIELLESLRKRPSMYVGEASYIGVRGFLHGLQTGLSVSQLEYTWEEYFEAAQYLGYDSRGNIGIERDFIKKGFSEAEKIQALASVEIAAYTKALARIRKKPRRSKPK